MTVARRKRHAPGRLDPRIGLWLAQADAVELGPALLVICLADQAVLALAEALRASTTVFNLNDNAVVALRTLT
jgi:hypothetical protein